MRYSGVEAILALAGLLTAAAGAHGQLYAQALPAAEDTLEARVWLDRGAEPVVEWGDEVRVYYRTSHDAYAAIFRIDTDGRIELLYPQHPDADPWVLGGRDYRLLFRDGSRWRVREDPGVGYFFMVASPDPLDFSILGWDADEGWDLSGIGETVYEDPYVAIDDYVAALLPTWDTTPYALDFLEYSVGEDHDYPRFLCYDCHGFQSYARWDPYDRFCSTYRVVIWDDPYFLPRYRYVGTRVVFARPFGPRPRYGITVRTLGSSPRPIVRNRAAPPRRTAVFKESPRARSSSVVPRRRPTASSAPRPRSAPSSRGATVRPRGAAASPGGTRARPSTRAGPSARLGRSGAPPPGARGAPTRRPATGRSTPSVGRRGAPEPGARRPPPSTARERPTLQRRPPTATRPPTRAAPRRPGGGSARPPRASRGRSPAAAPRRPPRAAPNRTPNRPPRAAPTRTPRAAPQRPPPRVAPTRTPRAAPTRVPRSTPPRASGARPTRPGGPPSARSGPRRPGGDSGRRGSPPPRRPGG